MSDEPVKIVLLPDDHEGGEQDVEVLPPENAVLFSTEDVEQALDVYRQQVMASNGDTRKGILAVMMFALQIAAINLGVRS